MPSYGVASTPVTISVPKNVSIHPYTLLIFADSTFPNEFVRPVSATSHSLTIPSNIPIGTQSANTQASLIIYVQNPLSPIDQFSDFWNKLGSPITFIYGIIAGLAFPLHYFC
jgi:hypothetical protein